MKGQSEIPDEAGGEVGGRLRALRARIVELRDGTQSKNKKDRFEVDVIHATLAVVLTEIDARLSAPVVSPPLEHAAKLLALSLTDEMMDSLRADYGNTNVAVLRHWKAEVLAAAPASVSLGETRPRQTQEDQERQTDARLGLRADE